MVRAMRVRVSPTAPDVLGYRQVRLRHRILNPTFVGSNPTTPASQSKKIVSYWEAIFFFVLTLHLLRLTPPTARPPFLRRFCAHSEQLLSRRPRLLTVPISHKILLPTHTISSNRRPPYYRLFASRICRLLPQRTLTLSIVSPCNKIFLKPQTHFSTRLTARNL